MTSWRPETFICAPAGTPLRVEGLAYGALAIFDEAKDNQAQPRWCVIHLPTGMVLCWIVRASPSTVKEIVVEFYECGDWDFSSVDGWRNRDPALEERVYEVVRAHEHLITVDDQIQGRQEIANQVAAARAN